MNWDAIGAGGEVAGAIAVFLTLLYLTVQVRHSRRLIESQVTKSSYDQFASVLGVMGSSPQVCDLMVRGFHSMGDLTEAEQFQFGNVMFLGLNALEHRFKQSDDLARDPDVPMLREVAKLWLDHPGGQQFWRANRTAFSADFTTWLDQQEKLNSRPTQ